MRAIVLIDINEKYIGEIGTKIQVAGQKYNCKWKLKSIPKKKSIDYDIDNIEDEFFAHGWNECIDEILGEEDE